MRKIHEQAIHAKDIKNNVHIKKSQKIQNISNMKNY